METVECYGMEVKVHKFKEFFRMGFFIESEKLIFDDSKKPLFEFNAYRERFYLGSVEFKASSLRSAKKKLDRWLLNNFLDEFEFKAPYENSYRFNKDNFKMRIHYVNKIIRDSGEEMHKYCPLFSHKNHSEAKTCRECGFQFFRG
ncbi:hypothetical protein LCGC14_1011370 [marine sediment metagenome]|uniref:Uncharacterized protein n=1 Tax=marine sediment metagenome TaxID=412755 RepID=A0A0F9NLJ9_9ZZZZ|nr:hypothetical protein [bacterium]